MTNTTEVLKVEEVHGGGRNVRGADHRLRKQVHQAGDALQVDGNGTALQDAAREGPRGGEVPVTDEAGRDGEQVDIRERHRVVRETVRTVLRVRQVDRYGLRRLPRASWLTLGL